LPLSLLEAESAGCFLCRAFRSSRAELSATRACWCQPPAQLGPQPSHTKAVAAEVGLEIHSLHRQSFVCTGGFSPIGYTAVDR